MQQPASPGRIVVGVDASRASRAALRWAAAEASLRRAELVVVHAWDVPSAAPYAPVGDRPTPGEERERAHRTLMSAVRTISGDPPPLTIMPALSHGAPARVLLDEARDADLLVLGGHHADSPRVSTVGATAAACLRQAPCPVVIIAPALVPDPA